MAACSTLTKLSVVGGGMRKSASKHCVVEQKALPWDCLRAPRRGSREATHWQICSIRAWLVRRSE